MSTILLSSILSNIGRSIFGTIGSIVGSQVGAYVGYRFDTAFLGTQQDQSIFLNDFANISSQTISYGVNIPTVLGRAKLAGNIIWAKPIVTEFNKIEFLFDGEPIFFRYATFAVAVCSGVVDEIISIYANDEILDIDNPDNGYEVRIYKGGEDQDPDPIILEYENGEAPAYRHLCYVVFENFPLSNYGNQMPTFSFEVSSNPYKLKNDSNSLTLQDYHKKIKYITLMSGHGEFVYSDTIQFKRVLKKTVLSNGDTLSRSDTYDEKINNNTPYQKADFLVTVDRLKKDLPNLESVALEVSWYTSSLNFDDNTEDGTSKFDIYPAVKYKDVETYPDSWNVTDNITRDIATAVQLDPDLENKPIYDGTPSDQSLISALKILKDRGYKIMLHPTLKVNDKRKPSITELTGSIDNIEVFFEKYNKFILHYAELVNSISTAECIFVDIFVIGSDLKGITSLFKDNDGTKEFVAVKKLVELAKNVRDALTKDVEKDVKITYAANWMEYHSDPDTKIYHLDELWSSEFIDYVGINAFFPITDGADGEQPLKGFPLDDLYDGWEKGEGYEYYYADTDVNRETQITYDDRQYAWKDIAYWWGNSHKNSGESEPTEWVPQSKKILFTSYGFSSVNGTTNQPSVFARESYDFSKLPYYSNGTVDFEAQRRAITATIEFWNNQKRIFVTGMFLYGYDVRPYPYYPENSEWYDSPDWQYGYYIQGKIATCFLSNVLNYLLLKCNINTEDNSDGTNKKYCIVDVNDRAIEGYIIKDQPTIKHIFSDLQAIFFFALTSTKDGIAVIDLNKDDIVKSNINESIVKSGASYRRRTDMMMPSQIEFTYINLNDGYKVSKELVDTAIFNGENVLSIYSTICMHEWQARQFVSIILKRVWAERWECKVSLSPYIQGQGAFCLYPGDFLSINTKNSSIINYGKKMVLQIFSTKTGNGQSEISLQEIVGYSYDPASYSVVDRFPYRAGTAIDSAYCGQTNLRILDIPNINLFQENPDMLLVIENRAKKYKGSYVYYSVGRDDTYKFLGFYKKRTICGYAVNYPDSEGDQDDADPDYIVNVVGRLSEFANSNLIDTRSMVDIFLENDIRDGGLSNICEDDFLAYKNKALIGNEIVNFRYADLVCDDFLKCTKYRIKTLMRGCFGTEKEIDKHIGVIDRFIMLDESIIKVPITDEMIGLSIKFKVVSVPDFKEHYFEFVQDVNSVACKPPIYLSVRIENKPPEGNKTISNLILEWKPQCYGNQPLKSGGTSDTNASEESYEIRIIKIFESGNNICYKEAINGVRRFEFDANNQKTNLGEFLKDNLDSYTTEVRQISKKYGFGLPSVFNLSDANIINL